MWKNADGMRVDCRLKLLLRDPVLLLAARAVCC
jgi:hypothetical protein